MTVWQRSAEPDTLTDAGDKLENSIPIPKIFNEFLTDTINSGDADRLLTFNDDGTVSYADRGAIDDETTLPDTDITSIHTGTAVAIDSPNLCIIDMISIPGVGKLTLTKTTGRGQAGAGNAPNRFHNAGKYIKTDKVTKVDITNSDSGEYAINSNLSSFGTD